MADEDPQPDERPRPKFGELAPPGWVWKPPEDVDRLDTARPNPSDDEDERSAQQAPGRFGEARPGPSAGPSGTPAPPHHPGAAPAGPHPGTPYPGAAPRPATSTPPRWNLTFTILLIAFGFFGMSYSVLTLQAFPTSMQLLHNMQGLGTYTPAPSVATIVTIGTLTMTGLWAVSTGLAVWQLVRRRLSFYIPLVAGVVALIALFIVLALVLSTDPALMDALSGVTPVSPAPSAPATP